MPNKGATTHTLATEPLNKAAGDSFLTILLKIKKKKQFFI